jgi:hypothetical protein
MIRPSGTEPVLKIYAEAVRPVRSREELAAARAGAVALAEELLAAAAGALESNMGSGRASGPESDMRREQS